MNYRFINSMICLTSKFAIQETILLFRFVDPFPEWSSEMVYSHIPSSIFHIPLKLTDVLFFIPFRKIAVYIVTAFILSFRECCWYFFYFNWVCLNFFIFCGLNSIAFVLSVVYITKQLATAVCCLLRDSKTEILKHQEMYVCN